MIRGLVLVVVVLLAAGCTRVGTTAAGAKNPWTVPHTLRIGEYQDLSMLNPHLLTSTSLSYLTQLTMAYLVRYDAQNRPVPELATEVPTQKNGLISADGKTITWHLRRGVRWSDGAPFDADDVVFSTRAVLNPKNNEIGRDGWDLISRIDESDKYTVVYHLKAPYSGFLPSFFGSAGANPCILPQHLLAGLPDINHAPYNSKPVGIGPYRYVSWKRGDAVELEANPYYWRGQPKIKKIEMRFIPDQNTLLTSLRSGAIDLYPQVPAAKIHEVEAIPSATVVHQAGFYYAHVDFNTQHPVVSDVVVRRALRLATNRAELRDKISNGIGVLQESQVTPVSPLYAAIPMVGYDPGAANALLDGAGWKRGPDGVRAKDGVRLRLVWASTSGSADADRFIELLRSMWKQVGVELDVRRYAPALFFGAYSEGGILYAGKFDVTSFSWGLTPDGDISNTNDCNQIPPAGQNVTRLCDPLMQPLFAREKAAYDEAPRKAAITATIERIVDDVPYFVLRIAEDIYAYNRDLTGWKPNAVTPFDDFMNADI